MHLYTIIAPGKQQAILMFSPVFRACDHVMYEIKTSTKFDHFDKLVS